jgi:hypothetical protein
MHPMRRLASPTMAHNRRKGRNDHDQAISANEQGLKPHYKVRVMLPNVAFRGCCKIGRALKVKPNTPRLLGLALHLGLKIDPCVRLSSTWRFTIHFATASSRRTKRQLAIALSVTLGASPQRRRGGSPPHQFHHQVSKAGQLGTIQRKLRRYADSVGFARAYSSGC